MHQQEQMDKLGMNVIPATCATPYPFGGGLTATADVYREGECPSTTSRTASRIPPPCAPRWEVSTTFIVGPRV